jgi:hypothetical protein
MKTTFETDFSPQKERLLKFVFNQNHFKSHD